MSHEAKTDLIRTWLPLIVAIASMGVSWGIYTNRISANEDKINKVEDKVDKYIISQEEKWLYIHESMGQVKGALGIRK